MQPTPTGWPLDQDDEHVPDFQIITDASWAPEGAASAAQVSIRRDLTGGGLPGSARGGTGFSVADGSVTVPQPDGAPITPWASAAARAVPGGRATLQAFQGWAPLALGSFIVDKVSGADSSGDLTVDLVEDQRLLDGPCTFTWEYDAEDPTMDASDVIRTIAASAGFDTSKIEDSGSPLSGVFDVTGSTNREVIQDIARATMGAAWQDETGALVYRNAESMRAGRPVEIVLADEHLEDIPWEISRDDVADRVEVHYTPASIVRDSLASITLWEASEKIQVLGSSSTTLTVDIEGTTDTLAAFIPIWDESAGGAEGTRMSRWAASTDVDGGGTRPADNAIMVNATMIGPSRVKITITNNTTNKLWLVDGSGSPCLILRTTRQVQPGEQQTVAWGVAENAATQPFEFDAGQWVQDAATAGRMLDWLSAQMAAPLAVLPSVTVRPDLRRQLGDIIVITEEQIHPEHTPLKAKALITGSDLSGDANGYDTTLTLALLGVTFADLDAWATENGVTTFADFDATMVALGITHFSDLDEWAAAGGLY